MKKVKNSKTKPATSKKVPHKRGIKIFITILCVFVLGAGAGAGAFYGIKSALNKKTETYVVNNLRVSKENAMNYYGVTYIDTNNMYPVPFNINLTCIDKTRGVVTNVVFENSIAFTIYEADGGFVAINLKKLFKENNIELPTRSVGETIHKWWNLKEQYLDGHFFYFYDGGGYNIFSDSFFKEIEFTADFALLIYSIYLGKAKDMNFTILI